MITVEALKEGWDCSFAYVFCSVSRIQSARNVEQLFGRVLRMPYAERRQSAALNKAYAYVSEPSFGNAARALVDKLVSMGFEEEEAQSNIQSEITGFSGFNTGGQQGMFEVKKPTFTHTVSASPESLSALRAISHEGLAVRETGRRRDRDRRDRRHRRQPGTILHCGSLGDRTRGYRGGHRELSPPEPGIC